MWTFRILFFFVGLLATVRSDTNDWSFTGSGDDDISLTRQAFPSDDEDMTEGSGGFKFEDDEVEIDVIDSNTDVTLDEPELGGNPRVYETPDEEKAVDEETEDEVREPEGKVNKSSLADAPQFLAAVIVGGVIGLLFAVCVIMLLVYRMRKKDEGSYAIDFGVDTKKPHGNYEYTKGVDSKEYYA